MTEEKYAEPSAGNQVEFQHFKDEDKAEGKIVASETDDVERQKV